jgi:hypothetical protein
MKRRTLFYEVECRVYEECPHCDKRLETTEYTTRRNFATYELALSYFLSEKQAERITAVLMIKE